MQIKPQDNHKQSPWSNTCIWTNIGARDATPPKSQLCFRGFANFWLQRSPKTIELVLCNGLSGSVPVHLSIHRNRLCCIFELQQKDRRFWRGKFRWTWKATKNEPWYIFKILVPTSHRTGFRKLIILEPRRASHSDVTSIKPPPVLLNVSISFIWASSACLRFRRRTNQKLKTLVTPVSYTHLTLPTNREV